LETKIFLRSDLKNRVKPNIFSNALNALMDDLHLINGTCTFLNRQLTQDSPTHRNTVFQKVGFVLLDPHEVPEQTQYMSRSIICGKKFLIAMSPDPENCVKIIKDTQDVEYIYMAPTTIEESECMRICC
jgi:hypothetical protein